jgi:hypothetical protein
VFGKSLGALVLVGMLLVSVSGGAHERIVLDPDDTSGPLDIAAVRMVHASGLAKLKVVTYETWADSALSGDVNYIRFDLDRPSKTGHSRCIIVHRDPAQDQKPARWKGTLFKACGPFPFGGETTGRVEVTRPDAHSLIAKARWSRIWKARVVGKETIRFRAFTSFEDASTPGCEPSDPPPPEHFSGPCFDTTRWRKHAPS